MLTQVTRHRRPVTPRLAQDDTPWSWTRSPRLREEKISAARRQRANFTGPGPRPLRFRGQPSEGSRIRGLCSPLKQVFGSGPSVPGPLWPRTPVATASRKVALL